MTTIKLTLNGACAVAEVSGVITAGMVGIPVTLCFDSAWEGLHKTLVCKSRAGTRVVLEVGERAEVPPDILTNDARARNFLFLGVEGRNADGTLVIPSTLAPCGEIFAGATQTESDPTVLPESPEWVNVVEKIGDLASLNTAEKRDLVSAINELESAITQSCLGAITELRGRVSESEASVTALEARIGVNSDALAEVSAQVDANRAELNARNIDGAGAHNATFRGKALGDAVTSAQFASIESGTFRDLYIGDYWTIAGVNYRIAAFDYYYQRGTQAGTVTKHHITLVPDTCLYTHVMNDAQTAEGAYVGSKMYTEGLEQAKTIISDAFGSAHILSHYIPLDNAITKHYVSGIVGCVSTVELMTERNVVGSSIFRNIAHGTTLPKEYNLDQAQFPLFAMRPDMICNGTEYWLRDVAANVAFSSVAYEGGMDYRIATNELGVRPSFSIIA